MEDVLRCDQVRIPGVSTTPAMEIIPRPPIPPIDLVTAGARDAGVPGRYGSESDTVVLRPHLEPFEPVSVRPRTDRAADVSGQPPFDLSEQPQSLEPLHHDYVDVVTGRDVPCDLVHPLSQRPSRPQLSLRTVFATVDAVDDPLNVLSQLLSSGEAGEALDPRVHPDRVPRPIAPLGLRAGLDLEGELNGVS